MLCSVAGSVVCRDWFSGSIRAYSLRRVHPSPVQMSDLHYLPGESHDIHMLCSHKQRASQMYIVHVHVHPRVHTMYNVSTVYTCTCTYNVHKKHHTFVMYSTCACTCIYMYIYIGVIHVCIHVHDKNMVGPTKPAVLGQ